MSARIPSIPTSPISSTTRFDVDGPRATPVAPATAPTPAPPRDRVTLSAGAREALNRASSASPPTAEASVDEPGRLAALVFVIAHHGAPLG